MDETRDAARKAAIKAPEKTHLRLADFREHEKAWEHSGVANAVHAHSYMAGWDRGYERGFDAGAEWASSRMCV